MKKTMKRRSTEAQSLVNFKPKIVPSRKTSWMDAEYDEWYFENDRMSLDVPEEDDSPILEDVNETTK
jgi:hypothetical protein